MILMLPKAKDYFLALFRVDGVNLIDTLVFLKKLFRSFFLAEEKAINKKTYLFLSFVIYFNFANIQQCFPRNHFTECRRAVTFIQVDKDLASRRTFLIFPVDPSNA